MSRSLSFGRRREVPAAPVNLDALPSRVASALETLRGGSREVRAVIEQYRATVAEQSMSVSHDPNLSSEGRQARMREIRETAGQHASTDLTAVRERLDRAHTAVRAHAEQSWPKPVTGLEALLARQAAWARSRDLLESGVGPSDLVSETTSIETLHALREELPTWVRAHGAGPRGIERVIDERVAELTGERASVALRAAFEADAERAGLEPMLKHAAGEVTGAIDRSLGLSAAVAANVARQQSRGGGGAPPVA